MDNEVEKLINDKHNTPTEKEVKEETIKDIIKPQERPIGPEDFPNLFLYMRLFFFWWCWKFIFLSIFFYISYSYLLIKKYGFL